MYVFNTISFVGKNASGKTSAIELMECSYSILSEFRLEDKHYNYDNVKLEIIFYHEDFIYKYNTVLKADPNLGSKANFTEQHICRKKYYKSKVKDIYSDEGFEEITLGSLRKAVVDGNVDEGSFLCGAIAGMVNEIKPCKQIIDEMMAGAEKLLSK